MTRSAQRIFPNSRATSRTETTRALPPQSKDRKGVSFNFASRFATYLVITLAVFYGAFAGFHTIGDTDLGWQLATGRWIVQHHSIPSTDVLSYTAQGTEWIYPVLSQVLLYGLFVPGGYALLSWVGAAACAGTVSILLRRGGFITGVLAIVAVPVIAQRTQPRPEMFTELFFAAFVSILWFYHRSGRGPLWSLPLLMFIWVNSHPGFIAGLAMCGAYLVLEAADVLSLNARPPAIRRLRHAAPWLGLTVLATLVNPWGTRIYVAIVRQNQILRIHRRWVAEWSSLRINSSTLVDFLSWRDPRGALFWLLAVAVLAVLFGLYQRRFAPVLLLLAAIVAVLHAVRFQAPFASLVVVIGGSILADAAVELGNRGWMSAVAIRYATAAVSLAVVSLVTLRIADLVSNHYYLRTPETFSLFGPGETTLFHEGAAHFLQANKLPANILNDYNSGGFIAWTLPNYPDYFDGRSIPFGAEFFVHLEKLFGESPDSADWQREADSRGINTVILALDHELGSGLFAVQGFCDSQHWRPVFLDAYGALFLRVTPGTDGLLPERRIDCRTVQFNPPPVTGDARSRAQRFKYLLNAAAIHLVLHRNVDSLDELQQAELIFPDNPFLHYAKGMALQNLGRLAEAETELLTAFALGSDEAAYPLARFYDGQRRYDDEVRILSQAAQRAPRPYRYYLRLGNAQLAIGRPEQALGSFDRAEKESPFVYEAAQLGENFQTQIAEGRRRAQQLVGAK